MYKDWSRRLSKSLLLASVFAIASGCVNQPTNGPLSQAQISLNQAHRNRANPAVAVGYYLDAEDSALNSANRTSNTAANQSIYNSACQEMAILLQANPQLWNRNETISADGHPYRLQFATGLRQAGIFDPTYFDFLRTPGQLRRRIRILPRRTVGWGGELVGVHKPADPRRYFLPPAGLAVPVTAVVDFKRVGTRNGDIRDATFTLYDPGRRGTIQTEGVERPLAADFTATYRYYANPFLLGLYAMLRPASYQKHAGLYLLEPYDPDQIPVVFVHGLMSIPQMWVPTISAVDSDPELHGRFQFWVFAYPTGDPIVLSALRLRESLQSIYQLYPKTKGLVLIGHSMGGIVSQMQAVTTGRVLWNSVFQKDADQLYSNLPPDDLVKRALIFNANPRVERLVFICVPHRGSYLATNWIGALGISLIRFPSTLLSQTTAKLMIALRNNMGLKRLPTGINSLSPRSPVLRALDELPIQAPYNSIIGDRGRGDTPNSSDGVVAYWSSHLDGAQSELIVPGGHGSFALPQTIAELKRILRLHLESSNRRTLSIAAISNSNAD
jgi:pimeloyl-ACP methyl ester carboxylesterase